MTSRRLSSMSRWLRWTACSGDCQNGIFIIRESDMTLALGLYDQLLTEALWQTLSRKTDAGSRLLDSLRVQDAPACLADVLALQLKSSGRQRSAVAHSFIRSENFDVSELSADWHQNLSCPARKTCAGGVGRTRRSVISRGRDESRAPAQLSAPGTCRPGLSDGGRSSTHSCQGPAGGLRPEKMGRWLLQDPFPVRSRASSLETGSRGAGWGGCSSMPQCYLSKDAGRG
ncbi:hypothetical protein DFR40_3381 [Azonexus fungiphilus]|uniref:Uncharacterized protein n=1 Tax=Azonexus fungiphilus TaxID=146940 RepID=A0A495VN22_9RHOO|nr:hypothetical protein DFR40_3381 [Azonexus fungiphilus]